MGNAQVVSTKCCHCKEYGTYFCYDCKKLLCSTCRKDHDKYTSINRHRVIEYKDVNHQLLKADLNCSKHGLSFSLYCSSCKTLACNECITTSHVQHEFCNITTIVKEAEDDFNTVQSKLQEKRNILLSNQTKIKSEMIPALKTKKESVQQEMQNSVSKLKKTIDTVKEVTENFKEEIYVNELNKLTTTMKEIERIDNIYSSTIMLIKRTLSEKHHIGFLNCYQSLKEDVHSLEEIIDTVEDGFIPAFDFKDFSYKVINSMLLDMNESKIQDKDNAIKDLQEQVKLLTQQIQSMQSTATNNDITIKNLKSENLELIRVQRMATRKKNITIKNLQSEIRKLESSLLQTNARMKDSEIELQQKIKDLQTNHRFTVILYETEIENRTECENRVRHLESEIKEKNREMENLQIDIEEANEYSKSNQIRIQQLEAENCELKKKRIDDNRVIFKQRMLLDEQYTGTSYQQLPIVPWESKTPPRPSMSNDSERKSTQLPILSRESETLLSQRRPLPYDLGRYNTHKGPFS